jgi:hypothetical protein
MPMPRKEIERLYQVFSRYSCPTDLEGCPCCTSPAEAQPLLAKPLRALGAPELAHYAFKAMTTWGIVEDYKYFLPRILELDHEGDPACDTEVTLGKFQWADFRDWPAEEQRAVRDFISGAWREAVQSADVDRADALLCGAAMFLDDVTRLLDDADIIAPDFKSAYTVSCTNQTKRKLLNSFWERDTPNYQRVLVWVHPCSPNTP